MILTVDLSNTHINIGCVDNEDVLFSCRIAADKAKTADEYAVLLQLLLDRNHMQWNKLEGSILSSVVPELTMTVTVALTSVCGKPPMLLGPGIKTGLNIHLDTPSSLGTDLVAASVGAQSLFPLPVVSIIMDTATAIGVTDNSGAYIGSIIAPGLIVSGDALSRRASQLRSVMPQAPQHIIGKNTDECMRSGIIYGTAAMLDGLLAGIDEELGTHANVIATGICADLVIPYCKRPGIRIEPNLLHRGMWLIWKRNTKKS